VIKKVATLLKFVRTSPAKKEEKEMVMAFV